MQLNLNIFAIKIFRTFFPARKIICQNTQLLELVIRYTLQEFSPMLRSIKCFVSMQLIKQLNNAFCILFAPFATRVYTLTWSLGVGYLLGHASNSTIG